MADMRISRRAVVGAAAVAPMIAAAGPARAAPEAASAQTLLATEGRYLPRWLELTDEAGERARIEQQYGAEQEWIPHVLRDGITQYASFLGAEGIAFRAQNSTTAPLEPEAYEAVEAVEAIARAAADHRVVMLNEAHNASRHRALLARLLPRLRADGFTHLAAEAFAPAVETLAAGDSVGMGVGWYVQDPAFAEAVREALALGYRLVPYEQRADQRAAGSPLGEANFVSREQAQADNLAAVLARGPDARVLVFAGYGHIAEQAEGGMFAARFKRDTGIDPLTVGQAGVGAFGPHVEDAPPVRALLERFQPNRAVVLTPKAPQPGALTGEETDLIVLHPALPDIDGRPAWLAHEAGRRRMDTSVPAGVGPRLLQAIHAADADPAIPADQFLVEDAGGPAALWLKPGRYRLRLETAAGFTPLSEVEVV
jgi:hypothetical protein